MAESVVVDHVSKRFSLHNARTLKQRFVAARKGITVNESFLAIDDVSFDVQEGQSIGLMGLNGSGKSTMLRLINGVLRPDTGQVLVRGRVAGLIEISAGFQKQLSGRENIYLNAALNGMSEADTKANFDEILDFAQIEKFLDTPVQHYSSGMKARLGFAVAIAADSDVFIIDEVLAVGDPPFKKKCMKRIHQIRNEGRTVLFVSHDTNQVRRLCDRAIVMERGRMVFDGSVDDAAKRLHYDADDDLDPDAAADF